MTIKIEYQVEHREYGIYNHCKVTYEVRTLEHKCDDSKSFLDNFNDAFDKMVSLGGDPNKNIRWRTIQ